MNGKNLKYFALGAAIVAAGLGALAVTIPNSFSAGQVISAAGLNANFAAIKAAVDALEAPKPVTLSYPGGALNSALTQGFAGPIFPSGSGVARLALKRPANWDGSSVVSVELYFTPVTAGSGTVGFFIRPRRYNPGDPFADQIGITGPLQSVTSDNHILKQTIAIPANQLNKELWELLVQRESTGTYPGDVHLVSVALTYTANP